MKVGILTFHEVTNPGAYLQAMGTFSLLKSMGHEPVIIDYTAPAHRYSLGGVLCRDWRICAHPRMLAQMHWRNRAFQQAQKHFKRTPKLLSHDDLEKEQFDAVVIGADIVWDYLAPNLGHDPVYFGEHINAPLKISFAASCGKVSADNEPPPYVINGLKKLTSISVRDANTKQMVKKYAQRDSEIICDPAFHLDVELHAATPKERKPYLLVYMLPGFAEEQMVKQAKAYARKRGLKTIAVCYRKKWVDENRIFIGPQEWLGYVKNADVVVTNTFHGIIFSVKTGVPFVAKLNDAIRLKTLGLIDRLGIEDRFVSEDRSVEDVLEHPWDVKTVRHRIEIWKEEAAHFLQGALSR